MTEPTKTPKPALIREKCIYTVRGSEFSVKKPNGTGLRQHYHLWYLLLT